MGEVIILAGGLGTRLKSEVPDLPKCMAPIHNKPFIAFVIDSLRKEGVNKFILSLGYKHEEIISYVNNTYTSNQHLQFQYIIEPEPLGTGGAIKLALSKSTEENILITNGDTLFKADIKKLQCFHTEKKSDCTVCLKPMKEFDRYGSVELNNDQSITKFKEKQYCAEGLINGGLYVINKRAFLSFTENKYKFSFEKDYLEAAYSIQEIYGYIQNGYFIDIGIPEDYHKAQTELINL